MDDAASAAVGYDAFVTSVNDSEFQLTRVGALSVVGTGFLVAGQVTPESQHLIRTCDRLFYLVAEPATRGWLESLRPDAESLHDSFWECRQRQDAYDEIVERLLAPALQGRSVCAAFYGHPGVFVYSSHEAIRRARLAGLSATMLPGVSAEDCLFADLEIDPAREGCQSFEATDFLVRERRFDPRSGLILWQIGALGVTTYHRRELWNAEGLSLLVSSLLRDYPPSHPAVVYEASHYPVCAPSIQRTTLAGLTGCRITTHSTLYLSPRESPEVDDVMLARVRATVASES